MDGPQKLIQISIAAADFSSQFAIGCSSSQNQLQFETKMTTQKHFVVALCLCVLLATLAWTTEGHGHHHYRVNNKKHFDHGHGRRLGDYYGKNYDYSYQKYDDYSHGDSYDSDDSSDSSIAAMTAIKAVMAMATRRRTASASHQATTTRRTARMAMAIRTLATATVRPTTMATKLWRPMPRPH